MKAKKPRQRLTEVVVQEASDIANIVPGEQGRLTVLSSSGQNVKNVQYASTVYTRPSGKPKFLRSISIPSDMTGPVNPWKLHDLLVFVDASAQTHKSIKIFVCSSSIAVWQDEKRRFLNINPQEILVGWCPKDINPERVGWADIIDRVSASEYADGNPRILVIVDSDKNQIPAINARTDPVISGCWLPENHEIAYATADAGSESWINHEMRRRDKVAKRALKAVIRDKVVLEALQTSSKVYVVNEFESNN